MTDVVKVTDGMVISLQFVARLENGEVFDEVGSDDPLDILQGAGQLLPGLEQALYGMTVGEEKDLLIPPAEAFGERQEDGYEALSTEDFPPDIKLEVGMDILLEDEENDEMFEAFVVAVEDDRVILDLNHPLAGEPVRFWVRVLGIRPADEEELAHGHAHTSDSQ